MRVRLLFEPRDLWVGVYWTRDLWLARDEVTDGVTAGVMLPEAHEPPGYRWRVYVCLIPCFPIRFELLTRKEVAQATTDALPPLP